MGRKRVHESAWGATQRKRAVQREKLARRAEQSAQTAETIASHFGLARCTGTQIVTVSQANRLMYTDRFPQWRIWFGLNPNSQLKINHSRTTEEPKDPPLFVSPFPSFCPMVRRPNGLSCFRACGSKQVETVSTLRAR